MTVIYAPITLDFKLSWISSQNLYQVCNCLIFVEPQMLILCTPMQVRPQHNVVKMHLSYQIKLPEQATVHILELIQITYNYIWGDGINKTF